MALAVQLVAVGAGDCSNISSGTELSLKDRAEFPKNRGPLSVAERFLTPL
jgi:hypothetical protein